MKPLFTFALICMALGLSLFLLPPAIALTLTTILQTLFLVGVCLGFVALVVTIARTI